MRRTRAGRRSGITLVELLVVITILGLLTGIIATNVFTVGEGARIDIAKSEIVAIEEAVETFRYRNDGIPDDLEAVVQDGTLARTPIDPWGRRYRFERVSSREFRIWSLGPDGIEGNEDDLTREDVGRKLREE